MGKFLAKVKIKQVWEGTRIYKLNSTYQDGPARSESSPFSCASRRARSNVMHERGAEDPPIVKANTSMLYSVK